MNILSAIKRFIRCDSGAVTVDWVVLTAAVVALAIALGKEMQDMASEAIDAIGTTITTEFSGP